MSQPDVMAALFAQSQREQLAPKAKEAPTLAVKAGVGTLTFQALTLTTHELGKQMPGRHRWQGKELKFEATPASLAYVHQKWPNVVVLTQEQELQVPEPVQPSANAIPWEPRKPKFKHQSDANAAASRKPEFAYLMDMGTGKSKALIDDVADLVADGLVDRMLLVAPCGVHQQWVEDTFPEHWPLQLSADCLALVPSAERRAGDPPFPGDCPTAPQGTIWVRTVNFEALEMIKVPGTRRWQLNALGKALERFLRQGKGVMAIDESHRIKNPMAQCTWACDRLGDSALYRRILTGSPIAKGLEDYHAQFKFLNPRILGCDTMEGFKRQYCVMGGFQAQVITGYRNTADFHQAIAGCSWRVAKDEVLDLPPKLYSKIHVPFDGEQRAKYQELKNELMLELSDGTRITAAEAVQRMLRLQQITQGFLPRDDGSFEEFPHHRLEVLDELVSQAPDKVVIWARFTRDIEAILAQYPGRCVRYDGQEKTDGAVALFADPGSGKNIWVGNPAAGGTGVDGLQGLGSTVIYYSNSFNSIHRWQSEDRTHRIGTRGTVNYYDLVARGTMDAALLANLKRKRDLADMSLTELKELLQN